VRGPSGQIGTIGAGVFFLATAIACVSLAVPGAPPPRKRRAPLVEARWFEGARGTRALFACRGAGPDATLELDAGITPFGGRPVGARVAASVARREGLVACVDDGERGALRLRPMQIRAVTPSVARDQAGARLVLSIDGQALGPRVAGDDDVYLIWRGAIQSAASLGGACPEARWADDRVVVCLDPARLRGRGPARVRVQAAGRLEEAAGAPVDLEPLTEAAR
jgi:hypothetical protein